MSRGFYNDVVVRALLFAFFVADTLATSETTDTAGGCPSTTQTTGEEYVSRTGYKYVVAISLYLLPLVLLQNIIRHVWLIVVLSPVDLKDIRIGSLSFYRRPSSRELCIFGISTPDTVGR